MSYSRWSNSNWYTYWCVSDPAIRENRNSAMFQICGLGGFTAGELRKDMDGCLVSIGEKDGCNLKELKELKGYMLEFLSDVDARYPKFKRGRK